MSPHDDNPWSKEAEENSRQKSDVIGMTWKEGEYTIRVAPPIKKGAMPFAKYIVHWIPVTTGKKDRPIVHGVDTKCPVCKFVSTLWAEVHRLKEEEDMTDESPEVKKLVKQISKLRGKKTYDMNIFDRGDYRDEKGKIKIKRLVAGPGIWKPIIELGNSEKWGNPSSSGSRGYDLTVTVDGDGIKREYTILPDPDRKALTEEELKAVETAYDLKKLRKFSTVKEILDIFENAKPPLDTYDLKKLKKDLLKTDGMEIGDESDDESEEPEESRKRKRHTEDDNDDTDVTAPDEEDTSSEENKKSFTDEEEENSDVEEDSKADAKAKKDRQKEEKAFAKEEEEDPEDNSDDMTDNSDNDSNEGSDDSSDEIKLQDMECRGTYDSDDIGCRECTISSDCKLLEKEFALKAEKLGLDIDGMSGPEIEIAIKKKEEAKKSTLGKSGKAGKIGSSENSTEGKSESKKRNLPF